LGWVGLGWYVIQSLFDFWKYVDLAANGRYHSRDTIFQIIFIHSFFPF